MPDIAQRVVARMKPRLDKQVRPKQADTKDKPRPKKPEKK